ncbi:MAG: hypothetical protein HYY00_02270 [Chloroflexi bacterium]|nr:hypothetical protein [Chloroflexota bacterium]
MDRIVLFGAGASYGAGQVLPKAPPLGKDLYAELARYCPSSWGQLPNDIHTAFHAGFEQGMQILWDKYSTNIALLMRHMTLYLAQFRPDGSGRDLYSRFLNALNKHELAHQVLYSTLNYECVLELSASAMGKRVNYGGVEVDRNAIGIWKLHGSCNFLSAGIKASSGVLFSSGVAFEGELKAVNPNDAIEYCLSDMGLYPAMALYMNAKPVQVGQSVIHGLQRRWADVVRKANRLLVVGVRPYPGDTHIWQPLAECQGELGFVGPQPDFDLWRESQRAGKVSRWIGSRWDACFEQSVAFIAE